MPTYAQSDAIRRAFLASLQDLEDGARGDLLAQYGRALAKVEAEAARILDEAALLEATVGDVTNPARAAFIAGRAEAIAEEFDRFAGSGHAIVKAIAPKAYAMGVAKAKDELGALNAAFHRPKKSTVEQTLARLQKGTALESYFSRFGRERTQDAIDTMVESQIMGRSVPETVRHMRGKLWVPTTRLRTMVRTEALGAARAGNLDSYSANSDVVKGWVWNAYEDASTCEVCWAMNGTYHEDGEDLDSHPNCRCVPSPATESIDAILAAGGYDPIGPEFDTAAQPFDADKRFDQVLSEDEKLRVLGPAKYRLYRDGKIKLRDLVRPTNHPEWGPGLRATTLRELQGLGIKPAPTIDALARAEQISAATTTAETTTSVTVEIHDVRDILSIGKATNAVRARIDDALSTINSLHGIRSDVSWITGRLEKIGGRNVVRVGERRGSLPIHFRTASKRGEGGHFQYGQARVENVDGVKEWRYLPIHIVVRPPMDMAMSEYEAVFAHEFGHFVDRSLMPSIFGEHAEVSVGAHRMAVGASTSISDALITDRVLADAAAEVFRAAYAGPTYDALRAIESAAVREYMLDPAEVFARIYAQWIADRGSSAALKAAVEAEQAVERAAGRSAGLWTWTPDEFEAIGQAMDNLFRAAGMMR